MCSLSALAVSAADGAPSVAKLASELLSGPNQRSQTERLLRQLWELQHELPQPSTAMVCTGRNQIRVDLTDVDCDPITVRCLIDEITTGDSTIAPEVVEVVAALDATVTEQFLREFEDLTRSAKES